MRSDVLWGRSARLYANQLKTAAAALLCLWAVGCANQPPVSEEERVAARAQEWGSALIALDYDRALTYMTPTYQQSPRAERYRGDFSGAGFWLNMDIKWVKCGQASPVSRCEVRQIITMMKPPEMSTPLPIPYDTTWLLLNGEWYQHRN